MFNHQKYTEILRDEKIFDKFWWYLPMVNRNFGARQMSSATFDVLSACFNFRPCFSRSKSVTSVVQFFLCWNLRKSRKLLVADLLASCITQICGVTAKIQFQHRLHQLLVLCFLEHLHIFCSVFKPRHSFLEILWLFCCFPEKDRSPHAKQLKMFQFLEKMAKLELLIIFNYQKILN